MPLPKTLRPLLLALVLLPGARGLCQDPTPTPTPIPDSVRHFRHQLHDHREYRLGYPTSKTRKSLRQEYRENDLFASFVTLRKRFVEFLIDQHGNQTPPSDVNNEEPDGEYSDVEKTEATTRMREAVNEVLSGQLQLGNEYLLNAGRRKFPSVVSPSEIAAIRSPFGERDEWKELALAGLEFETGILEAMAVIRTVPPGALLGLDTAGTLRSRGGNETINTNAEGFPNYTIVDQPEFEQANAHFLRTEMSILFSLLNRRGLASTALVDRLRRLAFRENNTVDPRQRHGEAGEVKKEDLNRRAMQIAQRDAQLLFYTGLALRAQLPTRPGQVSQDDFKLHNGDKAFAYLSQLGFQFNDIRDGRLPSGLADQFVPSPNKRIGTAGSTGYLSDAITAITRALTSQHEAEVRVREYQQGNVSRVQFNREIRETYLTQLGQLTGFLVNPTTGVLTDPVDPTRTFDLRTAESRSGFEKLLDEKLTAAVRELESDNPTATANIASLGGLGGALVQRKQADVGVQLAQEKVAQIPQAVQRVEDRLASANGIVKSNAKSKQVWEMVKDNAGLLEKLYDSLGDETFGLTKNLKSVFAPFAVQQKATVGRAERRIAEIELIERIDLQTLDAGAKVKEIIAGKRAADLEARLQASSYVGATNAFANARRQVTDLVANLAEYRSDAADLYFLDASLEVEKDAAEIQADLDLQDCLASLYDLTRALEFYWTEKYQNPVQTVDGGIMPLPLFAHDFTEIDDLYAIADAKDAEKYLNALGFATSGGSSGGWDSTLRALRQSIPDIARTVVISLRQDVLGFTVPERALNVIPNTANYAELVQVHTRGQIATGREALYEHYENEAITRFRDRLQEKRRTADDFAFGTNRDPRNFTDGFEFVFTTNDRSAYFFDAREWNTRIETIQLDLRTEGGFLPPGQVENFVRLNLIQEGTVSYARSFPLQLADKQHDVYQTEFTYQSDRLRISPYEFPVQASVNGSTGQFGGQPRALPYFFSPVCSNWRIVLDPLSALANNHTDINKIKDIRLVMTLRSGIPPTVQEGL